MERRALHPFLAATMTTILLLGTAVGAQAQGPTVSVIVRAQPGELSAAVDAVRRAGGQVTGRLLIIRGLAARLPLAAIVQLQRSAVISSVTRDGSITLLDAEVDGHDVESDLGSMYSVRNAIGADRYWNDGWTGAGVGVALIDSGVSPVLGLRTPGKIVNGPDLSFESQDADLRYLDTYGHGTHLAGIIAGRDPGAGKGGGEGDPDDDDDSHFLGIAPGAHIVNVKVADACGGTDVSQVLAAIDWIVAHRNDPGLNIRVLNLSFGTDAAQSYLLDPLAYAAEVAWRKGIFVVVAAGNAGFGSRKLNNPALDPFVMAVGASDPRGTEDTDDDIVASFSSSGDAVRRPDLLAPGRSIVSLRSPGSFIDQRNPRARVGDTPRFLRGSGTSQSAAVVSGAAALIIEERPRITPDQLKALLTRNANRLPAANEESQGKGLIDLKEVRGENTPRTTQTWQRSTGTGSLERSRGSYHLEDAGTELIGARDIFGRPFDVDAWAGRSLAGTAWSNGLWLDQPWSGDGWNASSWSGPAWSGRTWNDRSWSGRTWSSAAWKGRTWSGDGWTGGTWSGRTWTSDTWSGHLWSGSGWPVD